MTNRIMPIEYDVDRKNRLSLIIIDFLLLGRKKGDRLILMLLDDIGSM